MAIGARITIAKDNAEKYTKAHDKAVQAETEAKAAAEAMVKAAEQAVSEAKAKMEEATTTLAEVTEEAAAAESKSQDQASRAWDRLEASGGLEGLPLEAVAAFRTSYLANLETKRKAEAEAREAAATKVPPDDAMDESGDDGLPSALDDWEYAKWNGRPTRQPGQSDEDFHMAIVAWFGAGQAPQQLPDDTQEPNRGRPRTEEEAAAEAAAPARSRSREQQRSV